MDDIKKLILNFIFNIFALIRSLFWKRDETIVLMDSWFGLKFADNPRFLFQYLSDNKELYGLTHVVWVTRNEEVYQTINRLGYEVYMIDSPESIYYHKHAKYHIVNNSPNDNDEFKGELLEGYSFGAVKINLWHGIAGKGVKFSNKQKTGAFSSHPFLFRLYLKLNDFRFWRVLFEQKCGWDDAYFLVQSNEGKNIIKSSFRVKDRNIIMTGYPRICDCSKYTDEENSVIEKLKLFEGVFLYLPTFRSNMSFSFSDIGEKILPILKEKRFLWIQKAHTADTQNKIKTNMETENVLNLDHNFDINTLLPYIDCLVTDYSSCVIDAIGLKKQVMFYIPDYEEYMSVDRGLTYNPDIVMVGPKAYSIEELKSCILNFNRTNNIYFDERYKKAYELYWGDMGGKTLDDVWKDIMLQVGRK